MVRVANVLLVTFLTACRSQPTGSAPAADSEHRGIAIAPVNSEAPSIEPPTGSQRLAGNGKIRCHMLNGMAVPSCAPGDSLCTCEEKMSQEEIEALMNRLRKEPGQSPLDRARTAYVSGDKVGARSILEPRVFGHGANAEEVGLLNDICKEQGDQVCRDKIKQMYP